MMPNGFILDSNAVIVAYPLEKHGMLSPVDEYIIFTSIRTLFWCFWIALKPLY